MKPDKIEDRLGRSPRDLRISVTDRCNFRCRYCMPREAFGEDFQFLPRSEILSFEEIFRLARVFRGLGVEKIRLTGGEPLLRRDLPVLVGKLASIPGIELFVEPGRYRVDDIAGGNERLGTITACGHYTAPTVDPPAPAGAPTRAPCW